MLRGFPFLQFALMGLLREIGRHLVCKRRISGKNLDKVNFWPHWQRVYDLLMIFFSFYTYCDSKMMLTFFYSVSEVHTEILSCAKMVKIYSTIVCLYSTLNTKRYIESYFLLHETASQDLFRIWETAQCIIPWIQAGKCHVFIKDVLMSSEWQSSVP